MIEHAIHSLINSLCEGRVYYVSAPQDVTAPYIVFLKVSAPREHAHDGAAGLARVRFQFSIFSSTYLAAKQTAQAMQAILQGYQGTSEGIYIHVCLYDNETDMYENNFYHVAVDYIVWHREE
ncbi:MAG: DUF3168 domain-containing protein [Dehalococcoidales bacterium]|nr:DUF3168 domain-containing protein [Dehalococcoidales bacterium]